MWRRFTSQKIWFRFIQWKSPGSSACWIQSTQNMSYQAESILPKLPFLFYTTVQLKKSQSNWRMCHFTPLQQNYGPVKTMQSYISLTAHFIIHDWTLESVCLPTAYFPSDHTGEIIAQGMKDALSSWNLEVDQQVCMTTDSSSNKSFEINWVDQPPVL